MGAWGKGVHEGVGCWGCCCCSDWGLCLWLVVLGLGLWLRLCEGAGGV